MSDEQKTEQMIQAAGKTAPRITPEDIDASILSTHYARGTEFPTPVGSDFPTSETALSCLTVCVLVLKNGFTVVGKSACASPANYDEEIGRKIAYHDARNQIWALEGYQLRTKLATVAA